MQKGTNKMMIAERIDRVEDLLAQGLSTSFIEGLLSGPPVTDPDTGKNTGGYGVSRRQVKKYLARVYDRWEEQRIEEAPRRREKTIRMAERLYARAFAKEDFGAAGTALSLLSRMTGVFAPHDPERDQLIAELGPIPSDPSKMSLYAQKCMVIELAFLLRNTAIDQEKRMRWMIEIQRQLTVGKVAALAAARVVDLEKQLAELAPVDPAQIADDETESALQELSQRLIASARTPERTVIDAPAKPTPTNGHAKDPEEPEG